MIYHFDKFTLDTENFELTRDGEFLSVEPQVFSVLSFLIENRDRVVTKDELINAVWDGRAISDGALNSRINSVRRAVGDDGKAQVVIKTIPRRGFRFVAELDDEVAQAGTSNATISDKPSIAVLPFDNLSGDPEQEYFSDGITEDIIAGLSHIRQFFVIARNTSFTFKGQAVDVQSVARDLGVRYVLEGSVRKAGNQVRISAQLNDGETGAQIWSEKFDRELEDIFAVQDEITQTVVGRLEPELTRAESDRAKTKPPDSLDAWELYHRGMQHSAVWGDKETLLARQYFEKAIERDPNFSRAHAGLSWTYTHLYILGILDSDRQNALNAARKAVELDDKDSFAHLALGRALHVDRKRAEALYELELAVRLNPNSAMGHGILGTALIYTDRADQAVPHLELSIRLSPSDPGIGPFQTRLAAGYFFSEAYEKAVETTRQAMQGYDHWFTQAYLASSLAYLGEDEKAADALANLLDMEPNLSREFVYKYHPGEKKHVDIFLAGLYKAGLPEI